jgi:hypothetical protein
LLQESVDGTLQAYRLSRHRCFRSASQVESSLSLQELPSRLGFASDVRSILSLAGQQAGDASQGFSAKSRSKKFAGGLKQSCSRNGGPGQRIKKTDSDSCSD